jgi:hypothetical protein
MLSAFAVQPILATAEEARGNFTLTHEAVLQNQVLPAGEYTVSLKPSGPTEFLLLQSVGKPAFGTLVIVTDVESAKPHQASRVVLVSKNGKSYVSAIELPQFDIVLRFKVPAEKEKPITTAALGTAGAR